MPITNAPQKAIVATTCVLLVVLFMTVKFFTSQPTIVVPDWHAYYLHNDIIGPCSTVYLDVGSNRGVTVRKLYEPDLYPNALMHRFFDVAFGPVDGRRTGSVCAYMVEPNPKHSSRLTEIAACYTKQGWPTKYLHRGISNFDGTTKIRTLDGSQEEDWGAHLSSGEQTWQVAHQDETYTEHDVKVTSFLTLYDELELKGKRVLMKMDIEGSEYGVLAQMAKAGLLCADRVEAITIEFHKGGGYNLRDLISTVKVLDPECKQYTSILDLDDESYLHDGPPLPCT